MVHALVLQPRRELPEAAGYRDVHVAVLRNGGTEHGSDRCRSGGIRLVAGSRRRHFHVRGHCGRHAVSRCMIVLRMGGGRVRKREESSDSNGCDQVGRSIRAGS